MAKEVTDGLVVGSDGEARCWWGAEDADYVHYHDTEWGFPVGDDTRLFEKICLEGFQSGLSWLTILRKRDNFRSAFAGFDPQLVAEFGEADVSRLLEDAGIVRHRGKIEATINNAGAVAAIVREFGSLSAYAWSFEPSIGSRPSVLTYEALLTMTSSPESVALARDLKQRGWRFFGPTTAYAFMQAMGLVNDHVEGCAVRPRCLDARGTFQAPAS